MKKVQQKWIPYIEVECSEGRVRVYEACKKAYCFEEAWAAARIMRDEQQAIGGRVLIIGVEKALDCYNYHNKGVEI